MKYSVINKLIFLIFLSVLVIGCAKQQEKKPANETSEEVIDTGVISVESYPSGAQVYVDGEFKGESPLTIYNFPVGKHEITVRRNGYENFKKTITLQLGKTEEVKVTLSEIKTEPAKQVTEENKSMAEKVPENAPSTKLNKVNVNNSFIIYYDFKNSKFTETTSGFPDVFSSNYKIYLYFTAISPSRMRLLNKQIKDVSKEDCINANDAIANLYSGQTLCIKTTNGAYAAIGGNWANAPTYLEWELFS